MQTITIRASVSKTKNIPHKHTLIQARATTISAPWYMIIDFFFQYKNKSYFI
jgi:hypothetical protein